MMPITKKRDQEHGQELEQRRPGYHAVSESTISNDSSLVGLLAAASNSDRAKEQIKERRRNRMQKDRMESSSRPHG